MKCRQAVWELAYKSAVVLLWPLNRVLCLLRKDVKYPNSVLHISYMVHVPYNTTRVLRRLGMKADYLAVKPSETWNKCDYLKPVSRWPHMHAFAEFRLFWQTVARYEVIHCHFMLTMSDCGWELPFLKRMKRTVVIHYRGCEIRHPHSGSPLCEDCGGDASSCGHPRIRRRRRLAAKYGDLFLVTTPDLKEFAPDAIHLPFFAPELDPDALPDRPVRRDGCPKIVHATNQPKLEGTRTIQTAVNNLIGKGYDIEFVFLKGVPYEKVLGEYATADLAIGKMKMGYYANSQIESMYLGVPTITYVRPDFMTAELAESGFIFTTLEKLEATLEHYLTHPEELEKKRQIAQSSILKLHDNERLGRELMGLYEKVTAGAGSR